MYQTYNLVDITQVNEIGEEKERFIARNDT